MDYDQLLKHLKYRRDYYKSIDFNLNARDLSDAVKAIELLLKENQELKEKK